MADVGYISLFLALVASVYSAVAFVFAARKGQPALLCHARSSLLAVGGLVSISVGILVHALVTHNFRIEYVTSYTSRDLPLAYLISALWAGNDGSLLFWAWLISVFAAATVLQRREIGRELVPYAASIIMAIQAFFLVLLLAASTPFHELAIVPADGRGLNPLLENPGMLFHPPLLLAGYVGFTIPFAFAIAALVTRRLGNEWLIVIRRWTLLAWLFLGLGNLIGAWWAYVELGWGGYWAWDPVENAGLMPWLVATAFLHSIVMQRRRGIFKVWNMVLVIVTFALSIFGTFLTRSGVLSSIHAFGESNLGPFLLAFVEIALVGSLGLLYYRRKDLRSETEIASLISRESTFLLNNLLLVGATFAILLGTVFPVISQAVHGVRISVGPPFYNQVSSPIFLVVILLAGVCTLLGWRRASIRKLARHFLWSLATALLVAVALLILGTGEWYALAGFSICGFVVAAIFYEWFRGTRARQQVRGESYLKFFWGLIVANRPRYGGYIIHLAIVLIAIGVIGSSLYEAERDVQLTPGESMTIEAYTLTYENLDYYETESKKIVTATLAVYNHGRLLGRLRPEKYFHRSYEQPVTEVAIRSTLGADLYVILIGWEENGRATFRTLINPLVNWIWIGGGVLVFGGVVVFWSKSPI